jgi:hypothetical protein
MQIDWGTASVAAGVPLIALIGGMYALLQRHNERIGNMQERADERFEDQDTRIKGAEAVPRRASVWWPTFLYSVLHRNWVIDGFAVIFSERRNPNCQSSYSRRIPGIRTHGPGRLGSILWIAKSLTLGSRRFNSGT